MATYAQALLVAIAQAYADHIEGGDIRFETSGDAEVATVPLGATLTASAATPSVIDVTGGSDKEDSSAAGGTIDHADIRDSGGTPKVEDLTCGVGSGQIQLNTLTVGAGNTVRITTPSNISVSIS